MAENKLENIKTKSFVFYQNNRALVIVLGISVILIGWLYISNSMKIRSIEQTVIVHQTELAKQSETRQSELVKQSLIMLGVPTAWAIRRELMANNTDQIDQYISDLLKYKGFEQIVVTKTDGKIIVASDRKFLGNEFSKLYPASYLTAENITVEDKGQGKWLLAIPIMGFSGRIGTVVIDYSVPPAKISL